MTEEKQTQKKEEKTEEVKTKVEYLPQSQPERSVKRILVIGNSGSNDVFFHLARTFHAQGYTGRYTLAFLYYSGCTFDQHAEFGALSAEVYDYYESDSAEYTREEGCTMERALKKYEWDLVLLQAARADFLDDTLHREGREQVIRMVDRCVPTEHELGFMGVWPNPDSAELWSDSWWRTPPATARESFLNFYGGDSIRQQNHNNDLIRQEILGDERFSFVFSAGAAVLYARNVLGLEQTMIHRDYTHLSDFGRLIASYTFYAQLTGQPIDEVRLDVLPAKKRQSHYQVEGDLVLNGYLKNIIKECANYALENTWAVPTA